MASKYSKGAAKKVGAALKKQKAGKLKSGKGGKGGTVKNRKQAIAIGLSEARKAGSKVPAKPKAKTVRTKKTVTKTTRAKAKSKNK